jgi:hypothetical protein
LIISCNNKQKGNQSEKDLVVYLKNNWQTPENYVIDKFKQHDYVILGELHYVKHDVDLILKLIPKLYENGIYNIASEFGAYPTQSLVDSLLSLPYFDRKLAREITFESSAEWAFKEYIDIYEVAWKVNHSTKSDSNKFRIINIAPPFYPCKKEGLDRFGGFHYDRYMAENILKEIASKGQKVLIYTGFHHAFTKYNQPVYDFDKDTLYRLENSRMGNVLYDTLKERTFNIYLHSPWVSDNGWDKPSVMPVNGTIDSVMDIFENKPIGFDVINSPFGKLTSSNSYYAIGYPDFTLDEFCDGYIYQNKFKNYEPITMEKNYITSENIDRLKIFLKCTGWSKEELDSLTIENANQKLFNDVTVDMKHLMK